MAFSSISTEEGWQKQTIASECSASNQRPTKKAGNGMALFLSVLGFDMIARWTLIVDDTGNSEGWKICNSGEFWTILLLMVNCGCVCEIWMLVRILLLATSCLVNSEVIWYPRWTHHQASPHFIRDPGAWEDTLGYTPKGEGEMRWDEIM